MKKILLTITLLFSIHSYADFESGLIMGLIVGADSGSNTTIIKDEFTTQVEIIERGIPTTFNKQNPILTYSAYIDQESHSKYTSYFKNKGYNVYYNNGKLLFDLTTQYHRYLHTQELHQQGLVFIGKMIGYFLLVLIIASILRFILEYLYVSYKIYGTDEGAKIVKLILMISGKIKKIDTDDTSNFREK